MKEFLQEALSQALSAWRFRWWGVAVAWAIAPVGWIYVSLQPDVYLANTQILVDTSSVLSPLLGDNIVESDVDSRLLQERQKLLSRASLEQVSVANNLGALATTEVEREAVLQQLRDEVVISARPASQQAGFNAANSGVIFAISYRHQDAAAAVGVVTAFKDLLVEGMLSGNRQGAEVASDFLERQIGQNAALLEQAQELRLAFQRANADRLPGTGGGIQQRIQSERDALDAARRDRRLAESTRAELEAKLRGESPVAASIDSIASREPAPG